MHASFAAVFVLLEFVSKSSHGQTGLSEVDKQKLLDVHNYFRSVVYPRASNMERMVWSDKLAQVAQNYAERCVFEHNPNRSDHTPSFPYVGENLAITTTSPGNYSDLAKGWRDEVKNYDYVINDCSSDNVCGHYTQLVWADSNSLGCGAYRCAEPSGFSYTDALLLVCNYGPGGNIVSQRPYTAGSSSCSRCTGDKPHCVNNLCSATGEDSSVVRDKENGAPAIAKPLPFVILLGVLFLLRYILYS